jgi:hypothetical protein
MSQRLLFFEACIRGDTEAIRRIQNSGFDLSREISSEDLESEPDAVESDKYGEFGVILASREGHLEVVRLLQD